MNKSFHTALRTTFLSTIVLLGFSIVFLTLPEFDTSLAVRNPSKTTDQAISRAAFIPPRSAESRLEEGISRPVSVSRTRNKTDPRINFEDSHSGVAPPVAHEPQQVVAVSGPDQTKVFPPSHVILDGILVGDTQIDSSPSDQTFRSRISFQPNQPKPFTQCYDSSHIEARLISMENRMAQLAGAQLEKQTTELQRATQLLQDIQQTTLLTNLESELKELKSAARPAVDPSALQDAGGGTENNTASINNQSLLKSEQIPGDPDKFSLTIQGADITEVLGMLGQLSGSNILAGQGVTGTVTANLQSVSIDEALVAITRSLGLDCERDGGFIFVELPVPAEARKQTSRRIVTKIYRPQYINVIDLKHLLTPLLTQAVGLITTSQVGKHSVLNNAQQANEDSLSQTDSLLLRDYEDIVQEIDQIVAKMDVPPMQVVIDARILSVRLTDAMAFGVNFALLSGNPTEPLVSGNGATLDRLSGFPDSTSANTIIPAANEFLTQTAGLKYGIVQSDVSMFIRALENIADTNLIASPRLTVVNKQKAELNIYNRIGHKTLAFNGTQTVEKVRFLDVGTKLLIRPFASPGGNIRLEIHPKRSSTATGQQTGLPSQKKRDVTTSVLIRDGRTIVVGGLIEEQIAESLHKIPLLSSLPVVGAAFRNKSERIDRNELIILLTPRIVRGDIEGESQDADKVSAVWFP